MSPETYREASKLLEDSLAQVGVSAETWIDASSCSPAAKQEALRLLALQREADGGAFLEGEIARHRASWNQTHLGPGALIAQRYRVESLLGEGGMGEVYAVFDLELKQLVALKTLHSHLVNDPVALERFRREVLHLREINHPHVIRIHEFGKDAGRAFYTMELLEGQTLAERIREAGALPESEVLCLASAILDGLDAVHAQKIVHRDLKPSNIFLTKDARTVLMDFGIATAPGQATLTQTEAVLGSLDYMSPEQLEGLPVTPASDYYSYALLLYELRAARQPWEGTSPVARAFRRIHEPQLPQALPGALGRTIAACLKKSPADRPQDSDVIRRLLRGHRPIAWRPLLAYAAILLLALGLWRFWPKTQPLNPVLTQHLKLANQFGNRRTADDAQNALKEYQAVLEIDPNHAEAWTGLADVYSTIANFGFGELRPNLEKASHAAGRALALNPSSGAAQAVQAYIISLDLTRWREAEPLFQRAVDLDPNQTRTRLWYGAFLGKIGRSDEALAQLQTGLDLDPAAMAMHQQLVSTYIARKDWTAAIRASSDLIRVHPREPAAHTTHCYSNLFAAKLDAAQSACEEALRLDPSPTNRTMHASVLAARGHLADARRVARQVEKQVRNISLLVDLYCRIGERDNAVRAIQEAYANGDSGLESLYLSPRFDGIRDHAAVREIAAKLGFRVANN